MVKELKSTKILRLALRLRGKNVPLLPSLLQKFLRLFYGFEVIVSEELKLGNNVRFAHNGLGTVINGKSSIGNNVRIYQNVTIGSNSKMINESKVNEGAPVNEDQVTIFAGAVVVGNITIGRGSIIGANTLITKDVKPYTTVYFPNPYIKEFQ